VGRPCRVSRHLIQSPIIRKITFTGSVPVGKQLAALAGAHMKRGTMELGGHSPTIVFDDAAVELDADLLTVHKFRNAGQVCITPSRFFIQEKAYDRFMARFLEKVKGVRVGDGLLPDTQMGPLAHARRVLAMEQFIEDARVRGGRIETGGERLGVMDAAGVDATSVVGGPAAATDVRNPPAISMDRASFRPDTADRLHHCR